jgi:hypothetical protein
MRIKLIKEGKLVEVRRNKRKGIILRLNQIPNWHANCSGCFFLYRCPSDVSSFCHSLQGRDGYNFKKVEDGIEVERNWRGED